MWLAIEVSGGGNFEKRKEVGQSAKRDNCGQNLNLRKIERKNERGRRRKGTGYAPLQNSISSWLNKFWKPTLPSCRGDWEDHGATQNFQIGEVLREKSLIENQNFSLPKIAHAAQLIAFVLIKLVKQLNN